jgi:hypothetical protein
VATEREWAHGYLAQALADLEAARAVAGSGVAPSSLAMLLQMVFEKLAKAALLRMRSVSVEDATSTHATAGRLLRTLRRERRRFSPLGGEKSWADVLSLVEELERLQPQLARSEFHPKLEFPWLTRNGDIQWPEDHLAVARRLRNPQNNFKTRVLKFAGLLASQFDQLFP